MRNKRKNCVIQIGIVADDDCLLADDSNKDLCKKNSSIEEKIYHFDPRKSPTLSKANIVM